MVEGKAEQHRNHSSVFPTVPEILKPLPVFGIHHPTLFGRSAIMPSRRKRTLRLRLRDHPDNGPCPAMPWRGGAGKRNGTQACRHPVIFFRTVRLRRMIVTAFRIRATHPELRSACSRTLRPSAPRSTKRSERKKSGTSRIQGGTTMNDTAAMTIKQTAEEFARARERRLRARA